MIFAPRSCPSSPGFAMTTRILRDGGHGRLEVYERETSRHRLIARLAEPRQRPVRLPRRGRRAPPARLRARRARAAARRGQARRGRDRDHALPPRPLGRRRAVDVARLLRRPRTAGRSSGFRPAASSSSPSSPSSGGTRGCSTRLQRARVRGRRRLPGGRLRRRGAPRAPLRPRGVRLPRARRRRAARLLGRRGAERGAERARRRTPTSSSARPRSTSRAPSTSRAGT